MKNLIWMLLISALVLTACQPQQAPVIPEPTLEPSTSDPVGPYPAPPTPSPAQITDPSVVMINPYPEPGEESIFPWNEAETIFMSGQVNLIRIAPSGAVLVELQDGRILQTNPPNPQAFDELIQHCGALCANILIFR
jgi:hypothetical protein